MTAAHPSESTLAPGSIGQAPGYSRTRWGSTTITTVYDGALEIPSSGMSGESEQRITELLADGFLPPEGDLMTAVNTFLFELGGRLVLIDAGAGSSLGPSVGHLTENLQAAGVDAADIDDVVITHVHPDHICGLTTADGSPTFQNAVVHLPELDADWIDSAPVRGVDGLEAQISEWARAAIAPYREHGRLASVAYGQEAVAGLTAIDLSGHTPGHSGFLLDDGKPILFWGDTMHCHPAQLRAPQVGTEYDNDHACARSSRTNILEVIRRNGWAIGGAHLPFPGVGHIRFARDEPYWVPVPYRPLQSV
jgi:glyoxylase-like metal-dependent hydrolase (beta-lactamase superfamily II)